MIEPKDAGWEQIYPEVGLKINMDFERPSQETVERFRDFFVPDISDWVGPLYSMDTSIKQGYKPMKKVVGTAFTVKIPPGDNLMVKKALTLAEPGDVIVVDARGQSSYCCGGGGMLLIAKRRGISGLVVDGPYRDMSQIQSFDFPVFSKGVQPATGPKRGPGEIGVPVNCGGVIVHPGDIIVGDEDGLCCVPQQYADRIIAKCENIPIKENEEDWPDVVEKNKEKDAYYDRVLENRGVEIIRKK
ncbi:RraA family protein [Salicibibacter cibi]|uniref:Putative 4-hydroxy-4-methyl-2-oxoglutarate aldolase n=1 Tax=Salicibibacter cibi TaxID=2743001 RepID=A0A7T6ZBF4_9BACI|nr:RraA family protein [Salicibibacter cibi]QQK80416.1 RraA family protein [Salicibibacter cibi]